MPGPHPVASQALQGYAPGIPAWQPNINVCVAQGPGAPNSFSGQPYQLDGRARLIDDLTIFFTKECSLLTTSRSDCALLAQNFADKFVLPSGRLGICPDLHVVKQMYDFVTKVYACTDTHWKRIEYALEYSTKLVIFPEQSAESAAAQRAGYHQAPIALHPFSDFVRMFEFSVKYLNGPLGSVRNMDDVEWTLDEYVQKTARGIPLFEDYSESFKWAAEEVWSSVEVNCGNSCRDFALGVVKAHSSAIINESLYQPSIAIAAVTNWWLQNGGAWQLSGRFSEETKNLPVAGAPRVLPNGNLGLRNFGELVEIYNYGKENFSALKRNYSKALWALKVYETSTPLAEIFKRWTGGGLLGLNKKQEILDISLELQALRLSSVKQKRRASCNATTIAVQSCGTYVTISQNCVNTYGAKQVCMPGQALCQPMMYMRGA